MKITSAHIQGYRCIASLEVSFHGLTAFVGSGGVGKSTILNALDWFFHGGQLADRDLHLPANAAVPSSQVSVAITFSDLNVADRAALGRYVEGDSTTLTRTWSEESGEKLSGNALVFPDFDEVRGAKAAMDLRQRYKALHKQRGEELDLPAPANSREQVERSMEVWERSHPHQCELRPQDARHLGGFTGTPLLGTRFDYVLISADTGAPEALGPGRGTVLDRLLSAVAELDSASRAKISALQEDAQREIEDVVGDARGDVLLSVGAGITERVDTYFPGASVRLEDEVAAPRVPQISVKALVSDRGGHPIDPDLQGHGLQRALVIALLHELAETTDESDAEAETRSLMLAIEEPELFQHPLLARTLASSLERLAEGDDKSIQVAYSTHSPYFTRPALFRDLRLCRRGEAGGTSCVAADADAIGQAIAMAGFTGDAVSRVEAALATNLREAIFASVVILCEGPTDVAVIEGVGALQGGLDRDGVGVAGCGSKSSVGIAIAILDQLRIPFFGMFDADAAGQNVDEAKLNRRLLKLCGEQPVDLPERAVRERCANFEDTLETDLEALWPGLAEARVKAAEELGVKGDKKSRVYREASANAGEPPEFLIDILEAARSLR